MTDSTSETQDDVVMETTEVELLCHLNTDLQAGIYGTEIGNKVSTLASESDQHLSSLNLNHSMIIEPQCDDVSTKQQLPAISVESMTQVQLLEFIPKLVTLSAGQSAEISERPKWWPVDIPWEDSVNQFTNQDEVGVEVLRKVIRECYSYLGQENLLTRPNFPGDMKPLPSSPQTADSHLKATEPSGYIKQEKEKNQLTEQTNILKAGKQKIVNQSDIIENSTTNEEKVKVSADSDWITPNGVSQSESAEISSFVKDEDEQYEGRLEITETANVPKEENVGTQETKLDHSTLKEEKHEQGDGPPDTEEAEKSDKLEKQEDDVVWICFICAKEFPNQTELMTHQDSCEESSEEPNIPAETENTAEVPDENIIDLQITDELQPAVVELSSHTQNTTPDLLKAQAGPAFYVTPKGLASVCVPSISPVLLEHSASLSTSFGSLAPVNSSALLAQLQMPVLRAAVAKPVTVKPVVLPTNKPVPTMLTKVGSQYKSLPLGLPLIRKHKRKKWPDVYIPPPPETYFDSLGLAPTPKVKEIEETPKKSDKDCDIIDLTLDEVQPVTPRTPKSLISQWSREEASGRRRQLSFTQNSQPVEEIDEESSGDSDSSESSQEEKVQKRNVHCKSTLYAIPLTSPLGQRLKKNWQHEDQVPVVSDIEQYCITRCSPVTKNKGGGDVMDKLRHRPPPQVTFRFTKKYLNKYFHSYKFNRDDKREFKKKLKTGLEKESRRRLRQMKPCKVVLSRISKKDIKYWTTRGNKLRNNHVMNMQQHLRQKILLEQQKKIRARYSQGFVQNQRFVPFNNFHFRNQQSHIPHQSYPTLARFVSSQQQGPIPRLLVKHGMGVVGMPLVPASSQHVNQPVSNVKRELTGSQKRKQDFGNVRTDDEISIISLSSDEEDNVTVDKSKNCNCLGCQGKGNNCAIQKKPRIGPASFKRREASRQQCLYSGSASQTSSERICVNAQRNSEAAVRISQSAIGKTTQGGLTVSPAKSPEFSNFRLVNGQVQRIKPANSAVGFQSYTPNILNRSIINRPYIHSKPGSPASGPGSPVKGPCSPIKLDPGSPGKGSCSPKRSGAHVEKNDLLGYEVILIDSDEDD